MEAPPKPRFRDACNGCGACCIAELCAAAEVLFDAAPCPLLHWEFGRSWCGLVIAEQIAVARDPTLTRSIAKGLGIGEGCGMPDEYKVEAPAETSAPKR